MRTIKLTEEQIGMKLADASGWKREDGKWIVRKFRFSAFMEAIAFVHSVAEASESMNHHPLIAIDYKMVTLRLTSWNAGGLTALDFEAAHRFDSLYASR